MFETRTKHALTELRGAVETGDCAQIDRVLHQLKGTAALLGARRLQQWVEDAKAVPDGDRLSIVKDNLECYEQCISDTLQAMIGVG